MEILLDGDAAEDVVQQTRIAAGDLVRDPARSFRAWLATVSRNFARSRLRSDRRRLQRERASARPDSVASTEEIVEREEARREVVNHVLALDEPYRTAVLLRYYEELPPREIARRLEIPVETVKSQLKRAHAKLRQELKESHGSRYGATLALLAGRDPARVLSSELAASPSASPLTTLAFRKIASSVAACIIVAFVAFLVLEASQRPQSSRSVASRNNERDFEAPSEPATSEMEPGEVETGAPEPEERARPEAPEPTTGSSPGNADAPRTEEEAALADPGIEVELSPPPEAGAAVELFRILDPEPLDDRRPLHQIFTPRDNGTVGVAKRLEDALELVEREEGVNASHRFDDLESGRYIVRVVAPGARVALSPTVEFDEEQGESARVDIALKDGVSLTLLASHHEGLRASARSVSLSVAAFLDPRPIQREQLVRWILESIAPLDARAIEGGLVFDSLSPGVWSLTASAPGCETRDFPIELDDDRTLEIDLAREARLRVVVTDDRGHELAGAVVQLEEKGPDESPPRWTTARTSSEGIAQLTGLSAGRYRLTTTLEDHVEATPLDIHLRAGSSEEVRVELSPAGVIGGAAQDPNGDSNGDPVVGATVTARVSGSVVDARGAPIAGARVKVGDGFFKTWRDSTDREGRFSIEGLKGKSLYLKIEAEGFMTSKNPLEARGDLGRIVIEESISIRGRVLDPHGNPVPRARVLAQGFSAEVTELPFDGSTVVAGDCDDEGRYELHPTVHSNQWSVVALATNHLRSEERIVDGEVDGLELRLRLGGRSRGVVVDSDGNPVTNARVELRSRKRLRRRFDPGRPPLSPRTTTDAAGRFELNGLAPGTHRVRVTKEGRAPTLSDWFDVASGSESSSSITMHAPSRLEGRVLTTSGEPIEGVTVRAKGTATPGVVTRTDANGRFELHGLAAEALRVHVWKRGYLAWEKDGIQPDGSGLEIELQTTN